MNSWDEAYKQLNKSDPDPQLERAYESDLVHAIYGAIWIVVFIGLMMAAMFGGARWMGML